MLRGAVWRRVARNAFRMPLLLIPAQLARRSGSLALLCAPWLLSACPVDDRALSANVDTSEAGASSQPTGGGGDMPSAGGAGAGGRSAGGDAGEAGQSSTGVTTFPDGCADLDDDAISDCSETLLKNPAFQTDASQWTAEANTTIAWDARDMFGSLVSGSARVTSAGAIDAPGDGFAAAEQCLPVSEGLILDIFANAYIDAGQALGRATISLWFFAQDDCQGASASDIFETPEEFDTNKTITLHGTKLVGAQMRSVRVRLGVIKPFKAQTFSVRFDNLLVRAFQP